MRPQPWLPGAVRQVRRPAGAVHRRHDIGVIEAIEVVEVVEVDEQRSGRDGARGDPDRVFRR
jgi:hypothetical protein